MSDKSYERQVMRHLAGRRQSITFELDVKIRDTNGVYYRQIDIWLPQKREIVECKHHSRQVDVGVIDALVGTIDDIGADGGRIYSHNGFSASAIKRAAKANISCEVLPFEVHCEVWEEGTGRGYYSGDYVADCIPLHVTVTPALESTMEMAKATRAHLCWKQR